MCILSAPGEWPFLDMFHKKNLARRNRKFEDEVFVCNSSDFRCLVFFLGGCSTRRLAEERLHEDLEIFAFVVHLGGRLCTRHVVDSCG